MHPDNTDSRILVTTMREAVAEARAKTEQAVAVERAIRDMAVATLVGHGETLTSARRKAGVTWSESLQESLQRNRMQVVGRIKRRFTRQKFREWKFDANDPAEKRRRDRAREISEAIHLIWTPATVYTSEWSEDYEVAGSASIVHLHHIPHPFSAHLNASGAQFVNHRTGEKIIVYSLDSIKGARLNQQGDRPQDWDHRGAFRVERVSRDGTRSPMTMQEIGLPEGVEQFGYGWEPPRHPEHESFARLHAAIHATYRIISQSSLPSASLTWALHRRSAFGKPEKPLDLRPPRFWRA
ncbi:hypothetical protein AN948_05420 [Rhodococcus sp. ADH]|nr:hypothetical protein EN35_24900 [Rhodococcus qingshengii]KPH20699.1 hypothetical protein AN948_05420 [Rhodococcus sp. ADH]